MKKKSGLVLASFVHLILWTIFLLVSVVLKFAYHAPEMEPLDFTLSKGVYNAFIIIAVVAVINATVLFLSLRAVSSISEKKNKNKRIIALCFSAAASVAFYLFTVLLFVIPSDAIIVIPIAWFLFELCCGVLLIVSAKYR